MDVVGIPCLLLELCQGNVGVVITHAPCVLFIPDLSIPKLKIAKLKIRFAKLTKQIFKSIMTVSFRKISK